MEQKLLSAFRNNDPETLNALLHDDCLFVLPNGRAATNAMVLDNYRSGNTVMTSLLSSDEEIRIIGDTTVISFTLTMKGSYFDQVIDTTCRYIRVWKMTGGQWKVIAVSGVQL